jgi:hypothetical protein
LALCYKIIIRFVWQRVKECAPLLVITRGDETLCAHCLFF